MKNTVYIFIALVVVFASCSDAPKNALEQKLAELDSLQSELVTLKASINSVKDEIEILDTNATASAVAIRVDTIAKGEFKNPFQVQGLVESDRNVLVSPEVPSTIKRIHVRVGQRVSQGQIIASLDGSSANLQIAELENSLSLAKLNYEKLERLWNQNIGSEMQYLQAKNQYESIQNSIATARAQAGKYSLRSPINGVVDELLANEGEYAGGMTSGPVARIVNASKIKIKANVSEKYLPLIKVGQKVQVTYPSLNLTTSETVSAISNTIDKNNRTFSIYITPSKDLSKLKPNLLALVTAYEYVQSDVITIPTKLIRNDGRGDYVMMVKTAGQKASAEKRLIEVSKKFANYSVVESGITEGDLLIIEGYTSVINEDEVKIITE